MRTQDIEIGKRYEVEYFGIVPATIVAVVPGQVTIRLEDGREVRVASRQILGRVGQPR